MAKLKYIIGDAVAPFARPNIIAHVTNTRRGWGKGFVLALETRWPGMGARWRQLEQGIGHTFIDNVDFNTSVAHMCAQEGYASTYRPCALNYDALEMCLAAVAREVKIVQGHILEPVIVRMPRIGCGLAGGRWELVEMLVRSQLVDQGIDVYVYDLEKK